MNNKTKTQRDWLIEYCGQVAQKALQEAERQGVPPAAILSVLHQQVGQAAAYISRQMKFMDEADNGAVFLDILAESADGAQRKIKKVSQKRLAKAVKKAGTVLQ